MGEEQETVGWSMVDWWVLEPEAMMGLRLAGNEATGGWKGAGHRRSLAAGRERKSACPGRVQLAKEEKTLFCGPTAPTQRSS